jgi:hypothetical protein
MGYLIIPYLEEVSNCKSYGPWWLFECPQLGVWKLSLFPENSGRPSDWILVPLGFTTGAGPVQETM